MHITKIELEDFKSHVNSTFEFPAGTTAITGANGAGKTSIIEAVAWTLFDLLDYKKEDIVRRGAKKGKTRVTFESGLDSREYTVYRDTANGYYVFDPRLNIRIAEKKEDVLRFLWQHLGVEPGTDLESLFRRAIGVPQGTFTAIFLESPAERKKAFDKLLKVDEYRRGADELLKTSRHLESKITEASVNIARAEGELSRAELLGQQLKAFSARAETLGKDLHELSVRIVEIDRIIAELDTKETRLNVAGLAVANARTAHSTTDLSLRHKEAELERARKAADNIARTKEDSATHVAALARLRELERERSAREALRLEASKVETSIAMVHAEQRNVLDRLRSASKAHQTIESLRSSAADQSRLESEVKEFRNRAARSRAISEQVASLNDKISRLRDSYKANKSQLEKANAGAKGAENADALRTQDAAIVRELAKLQAGLARDEQFQREIQNGLCPILSQRCLNMQEGQTLENFIASQFTELKSQIAGLESEATRVALALENSRAAEQFASQISALKRREAEIAEEGERLKDEIGKLQIEAEQLNESEAQLVKAEKELTSLENPIARVKLLEEEIGFESELRSRLSSIESNLERLESDRRIKVEQLETYKDLDTLLETTFAVRERTEGNHSIYLANQELASTAEPLRAECESLQSDRATLSLVLEQAEGEYESASADYDADAHNERKIKHLELQKQELVTHTSLEEARGRVAEVQDELKRLAVTRESMKSDLSERERLKKVGEATDFIRATLKDAAPRVARNYVLLVSAEANQLFREISGNAEHTLKWCDDYGIVIEESGYERPFISLSGGEQMAAALAVRLALLKQLSDIRIAFFDEPTTNMDAERRENLAVQIGRIKHFDQLFVVSHDDTFEDHVDNLIEIPQRA